MLNKNILKYLIGTLSLLTALQADTTYGVDELILNSLKNSPNLHISKANYDASKNRYDAAYSHYLPNVNLHISAGEIGQNDISNSGDMINDTLLLGKLSAKQIIYDFGKTEGAVKSSHYDTDSYLLQNTQDISNKIKDVKDAYYTVLKALALINVHKENIKLNKAQLYRSKRYFEAGIRTKIDISDAKVALIQSQLDLKRAEYDLKFSYANLDEVVGFEEVEQKYKIYSEKLQLESLYNSIENYKLTLKESILFAYKHRAILQKQQSQINASKSKLDVVTSEYYPSLYILADYTKQSVDKFKSFLPENQWQATANLDWNIYQGGASTAKEQEQKIEINIANDSLRAYKLKIKKETTKAYINVYKNKDSVQLSQNLLEVSKEKFQQASKRYEHGLSDFIELQEARQGYIDAKATLIVDYYNYYSAVASLDNAIGK